MNHQKVPPPVLPPGFLKIQDVSAILGIDKRDVRELMNSGKLTESFIPGMSRKRYVTQKSLDRFIRSRREET